MALAASGWVSRKKLLGGVILVFLAQAVFSLIVTLPDFLANGVFPQSKTALTAGKLEISYWNNLLLAFLAVDALSRWLYRQSLSALPTPLIIFGILTVFASNLAFGARNGMIGSLILLSSLALLVIWHERKRIGSAKAVGFVGGAILVIVTLSWANYQLDPRWVGFKETAQIAWQPAASDVWLHPDGAVMPKLKSGEPVEASAYFRIAWIRAGLDVIADYPWGVGYGRNAFGHALRKTMETRLGHAHSGLIDWTIGVGVPGLILWLGFLSWLVVLGIRRYFIRQDPAGLILTFAVSGFFGRMLLDSINRDHMLMVFFLVLAILVSLPEEPVKQ
ncbi:MAG: O-antigen ligase family protein [Azonexus sp.]|nr:O-antigen ligase family protein [Azonexus sp.]